LPPGHDRPLPEPFRVEVGSSGRRATVIPYGDLDIATVDRLADDIDAAVAAGCDEIVLDLRQLSFIDVTGLRLVVRHSRRDDARLSIVDGSEPVSRLFDLTRVRGELSFVSPRELDSG
jgi:anti-anti-sigma factor